MAKNGNRGKSKTIRIKSKIGDTFIRRQLKVARFLTCVTELIKNSRDALAATILIFTATRNVLRIIDFGDGMGLENMNSFVSLDMSTGASDATKSALFGSGSKMILTGHSKRVDVVTAFKDDPEHVYKFGFTVEEFFARLRGEGETVVEMLTKNSTTWPYEHPFGAQFDYTYREPSSKQIKRGETLARLLSARLPPKFREIVRVDGDMLPEKEVVGSFDAVEEVTGVGEVTISLYNPTKLSPEDDLRLGSVELGEIPMTTFRKALGAAERDLPPIFTASRTCGVITAPFIGEHSTDSRTEVNADVADAPELVRFLLQLQKWAPAIAKRLKIRMEKGNLKDDSKEQVEETVAMFNDTFTPPGKRDVVDGQGPKDKNKPSPERGRKKRGVLTAETNRHEFEPGEEIRVRAVFRREFRDKYRPNDVRWKTDRSKSTGVTTTDDGLTMMAHELGQGVVQADIPNTMHSDTLTFRVVRDRVFKLSLERASISLGGQLPITGINGDKLTGGIEWDLDGPGNLDPKGGMATFQATGLGHAVVTATSIANPNVSATCDIEVLPVEPDRLIWIRDVCFVWDTFDERGAEEHSRPVTIVASRPIHQMNINQLAPGFDEARANGSLRNFLALAMAHEFSRFAHFDLKDDDDEAVHVDARDFQTLHAQLASMACKIYAELHQSKDKANS
jgi:hypothetical protein